MRIKTRIRMPWLEGLPWVRGPFRFEASWYYKDEDGLLSVFAVTSPLIDRKEIRFADEYYEFFKEVIAKELEQHPEMTFDEKA